MRKVVSENFKFERYNLSEMLFPVNIISLHNSQSLIH